MKVWISKYALSDGIYELDVELCAGQTDMVENPAIPLQYFHGEGREWHHTKEGAVAKAEGMRAARIASLRKQIAKLETLTFS